MPGLGGVFKGLNSYITLDSLVVVFLLTSSRSSNLCWISRRKRIVADSSIILPLHSLRMGLISFRLIVLHLSLVVLCFGLLVVLCGSLLIVMKLSLLVVLKLFLISWLFSLLVLALLWVLELLASHCLRSIFLVLNNGHLVHV